MPDVALRDYDDAERIPLRKVQAMKGRSYRREQKTAKRAGGIKDVKRENNAGAAERSTGVVAARPVLKSSAAVRGAVASGVRVMSGNHGRGVIQRGADNGK